LEGCAVTRREVVLLILAAADGAEYSPVQIQKATFLVATNLPQIFDRDSTFSFVPYDYGPFDRSVYLEIQFLSAESLANVRFDPQTTLNMYSATYRGIDAAGALFSGLREPQRQYIREVSSWVRRLSFAELVGAIYRAYPDMRANSIFRE
jgi:hypothetical protein